jgi:hypothetical protein
MKRWLGSDPWPKVVAVVTVCAFGGAYAVFSIRPWGPWCAGALMAAWVSFVIAHAARQAQRDGQPYSGVTFHDQIARRPVAAIVRILTSLACLLVGATMLWLHHIDAPQGQIDVVNATFWTLLLTSWIVEIIVDSVYERLERRRLRIG